MFRGCVLFFCPLPECIHFETGLFVSVKYYLSLYSLSLNVSKLLPWPKPCSSLLLVTCRYSKGAFRPLVGGIKTEQTLCRIAFISCSGAEALGVVVSLCMFWIPNENCICFEVTGEANGAFCVCRLDFLREAHRGWSGSQVTLLCSLALNFASPLPENSAAWINFSCKMTQFIKQHLSHL